MFQGSTGLITVAAVLLGLLLGVAVSRPAVGGQSPWLGPVSGALQASGSAAGGSLSRTITVQGTGEVRARPDIASVTVGVDVQAEKADEAQQQNAARMAAVIDAIKKLDVPEANIQTSAIDLRPVYDSAPRPPQGNDAQRRIVGYRSINRVTVRVDVARAGQVLDEAVKAGANVEGNIRFGFADDAELRQQALKKAVQNARGKADAIAEALGLTISGVYLVGEGSISVPVMQDAALTMAAEARAPTPVQPGEMTITAQTRVVYSY